MRRILFVDDEAQVLEGLRDSLRPRRHEWDMAFAEGGAAALAELARSPFDVVVSDMRMPGVSGAELLQRVRDEHPDVVRVVLSGHSEFTDTLHAAPYAHQFLAKPTAPDEVHRVIERSCNLRDLLADESLKRVVADITSVPSAPEMYRAFSDAIGDADVTAEMLGAVVEREVTLFAAVLRLVNAPFFGIGRCVTAGHDAVTHLGIAALRGVVLAADVFHTFAPAAHGRGIDVSVLERHATEVALAASRLSPARGCNDAVAAALLHDVGKLVMAGSASGDVTEIAREAVERQVPLHVVEREQLGITHAEVGACLLGLWGLPYPLVDAVARHHTPEAFAEPDATGITARANALVRERDGLPADPAAAEALRAVAGPELESWQGLVADAMPA
jgi:putative nucleotidyltransferase with HDIG domain